jgi:hypothetical protein
MDRPVGNIRQDNVMSALSSLSAEEADLLAQMQYLSERLETVQKVVKALSRLVHAEKASLEARS